MNPSTDMTEPKPADGGAVGEGAPKKQRGNFDTFVAKVRDASPEGIVNNGSRISFGLKATADGLSIWSALRKDAKSPWRLMGSAITLGAEILGTQISEKKVSEEKQEDYARMSKWRYFVTKTREAFNPREHIAETSGLALILNGFCLAMAGLKQSSKKEKSWEILQGLMTSAAGLIMNYMPDRERAWQVAHTTFMVRSVPAALQAQDAWKRGFPHAQPKPIPPGDWQQWAKWIVNQMANIVGTLYGGVKKLPDGSIIHIGKKGEDVTAPRQSRRVVESKETSPHHQSSPEHPGTKIQHVDRQHVMGEAEKIIGVA